MLYFFYLHTTIQWKYMVFFHLLFLLCTSKCPHWFIYFIFTPPFDQNVESSLIFFIWKRPFYQNLWFFFIYFFFCARPFDQKLGSHWFISFIWTQLFDQNLWFLFIFIYFSVVHDHSTKIRCHSYSLIYFFLNCGNILDAIFMVVLLLCFLRYFHGSASFMFCTLYSWLHEVLALLAYLALKTFARKYF